MLFSSPIFLFLFLPFSLALYYLAPKKMKNIILLVLSLGFYTWGEKQMVILILLSSLVDYSSGLIINSGKKKIGLVLSIVFNLSILIYFKYSNFIISNINNNLITNVVLPIGISFYTFQTMSYTIDVYRGNIKANKNFIDFTMYVTLFPQLIAGPIVRYSQVQKQLRERKTNAKQFATGVERFIIGLAKKMLIANNCAFFADAAFSLSQNQSSALIAWIGIIAYTLQIFFDFSGYSDMAIGLGKMFGFNFPENFNYPYISKSIKEFWRRWHITLSQWFRDYLYIPLGGNRKGNHRTYINLIIVFFLTGLWHGANWTFIVWGLFHGLFLIIERIGFESFLKKQSTWIAHFYTLLIVIVGWVIFRSENLNQAINYTYTLFDFKTPLNTGFLNFYLTKEVITALIVGIILSTPVYQKVKLYFNNLKDNNSIYNLSVLCYNVGLIFLFALCFYYIATEAYNPFIYFRF